MLMWPLHEVDDLGFHDTQVNNPEAPTPTIGRLVAQGIRLEKHYAYMYVRRRSSLHPTHVWSAAP